MHASDTIGSLAALANETRLKAYRLLEAAGEDGLPSGEIAERLEVAPTSLSSHLSVLARAGLVRPQRRGRSIIYRSCPEKVKALARLLVDGESDGDDRSA